jgi:hypothetical protein
VEIHCQVHHAEYDCQLTYRKTDGWSGALSIHPQSNVRRKIVRKMTAKKKVYEGSCYIGVVGSEVENGECRDSIEHIVRRNGDSMPRFIRATKGYEARQHHFVSWLAETDHPFMLLLDHDQTFPNHTLERLRSHKLPYVSGYYMRRRYAPIAPVWFENVGFPVLPWTRKVEDNTLYELGASGWGCLLIHREVAEATAKLLKGEEFVIEDDMDIWPYDLDKAMSAIVELRTLTNGTQSGTFMRERLKEIYATLAEEIKPLRGLKDPVGSDIRFPFFARKAGYQLYGDSGVRCGHMLNYPLMPEDYALMPEETVKELEKKLKADMQKERRKIAARKVELSQ